LDQAELYVNGAAVLFAALFAHHGIAHQVHSHVWPSQCLFANRLTEAEFAVSICCRDARLEAELSYTFRT